MQLQGLGCTSWVTRSVNSSATDPNLEYKVLGLRSLGFRVSGFKVWFEVLQILQKKNQIERIVRSSQPSLTKHGPYAFDSSNTLNPKPLNPNPKTLNPKP